MAKAKKIPQYSINAKKARTVMANVDSKMATLATKIQEYVSAVEELSQQAYNGPFQEIYKQFNDKTLTYLRRKVYTVDAQFQYIDRLA